jgi:hypothetical protein
MILLACGGGVKDKCAPRGDVRLDEPITSKTTPNGHELNVKRLAGDEAAVAFVPPPTSGHARHGSPAAAQQACPSA